LDQIWPNLSNSSGNFGAAQSNLAPTYFLQTNGAKVSLGNFGAAQSQLFLSYFPQTSGAKVSERFEG
jgi:hypothetical protein